MNSKYGVQWHQNTEYNEIKIQHTMTSKYSVQWHTVYNYIKILYSITSKYSIKITKIANKNFDQNKVQITWTSGKIHQNQI